MNSEQKISDFESSIKDGDSAKYVACMEEIKLRTTAIASILRKEATTSFQATNIEFVCLQIRKILELIALASITANKEEYSKQHANFFRHWKAKKILESVEKVNPQFYPNPLKQKPGGDLGQNVREDEPISDGFLTKDDFSSAYDACCKALHASNPYDTAIDYAFLEKEIPSWIQKIKTLLNFHMVQLVDKKQSLWVIMHANTDGKVHAGIMLKIGLPTMNLEEVEKIREEFFTSQKK
jgi:hypothetical protein